MQKGHSFTLFVPKSLLKWERATWKKMTTRCVFWDCGQRKRLGEQSWWSWLMLWRMGGESDTWTHCLHTFPKLTTFGPLRLAYRDIGGSDPERMAAPRVADYVQELFKDSPVKVRTSIITSIFCFCFLRKIQNLEFLLIFSLQLFFFFLNLSLVLLWQFNPRFLTSNLCVCSPSGWSGERPEDSGERVSVPGCGQPLCQQ